MSTFTPPLVQDRPAFLPDSTEAQKELWQFFEQRKRGVNVFKLFDGTTITYSQDTATVENSNTAIPYPWDFNNPRAPYVYITNFDGTVTSISHKGGTGTENDGQPYILFCYEGGHSYSITSAEATLLTNYKHVPADLGYGDCIT